jgi:hypothetical protein
MIVHVGLMVPAPAIPTAGSGPQRWTPYTLCRSPGHKIVISCSFGDTVGVSLNIFILNLVKANFLPSVPMLPSAPLDQ